MMLESEEICGYVDVMYIVGVGIIVIMLYFVGLMVYKLFGLFVLVVMLFFVVLVKFVCVVLLLL